MRRHFAALLGMLVLVSAARAQRADGFDTPLRSPAESRALFHLPPGFEIQLVAAEPDLQKPMNLAFDAAGRVWVTGSVLYPWPARRDANGKVIATFEKNWDDNGIAHRAAASPPPPPEQPLDAVRILSDFDPATGRARKITTFADGLNIPIGILPLPRPPGAKGDSAIVYSIPAIWRLTDVDGDGHAELREKLYDGFGFRDTHGMSSSYWLWFDGWVYGTHGFSNPSEVTDRNGCTVTLHSGNTYRFRPDGSRFELFARGQTNPFGLAFDPRGDVYTADSHSKPVYLLVPGGYYEGIGGGREHDGLGYGPSITLDEHGSTAIAGLAHYHAPHFPPEFRDNLFNGNPITRRINRTRLEWRGSTPQAMRQPDLLTSDDPAFRPVQVKLGPDGALWIADFYNPIIGHYEMPLTHPARDRSRGRIWRIVWRGLDGSVPAPALPNFATESPAALVPRLSAPNLVVRSLASAELFARSDAATAVPLLHAAATRLIAGTDPTADETAAVALLLTLDRLIPPADERSRASLETLLRRALERPQSDVALAALRVYAARNTLPTDIAPAFTRLLAPPASGHVARVAADVFRRHPAPWQPPLILTTLAKAQTIDSELIYALRLALKTHALTADLGTLQSWAVAEKTYPALIADVLLAVPTPAAAEFLLEHLKRTGFADARAGEFARHAVKNLPADNIAAVLPLIHSLEKSAPTQRLALAEGLASVAALPDRTLPDEVNTWMRRELIAALKGRNAALTLRAVNAVKPLPLDEKAAPLRAIAVESTLPEGTRTAALRALQSSSPHTEAAQIAALAGNHPLGLRRAAADLLGTTKASPAARAALVAAFSGAPADLALSLATALARSDAGAADLLELAASGRMRAGLLRHRYVATALEKRPIDVRERAAALTRSLPPEDARLDAIIAQRLRNANTTSTDRARGATVFAQHCAACHRFANSGGTLGPSLDGSNARTVARLIEDIIDPSRNVDPAFRLTTVTLKSGETKSGMNHRDQGDRTLLTDPATGQDLSIARHEIAEVAISNTSPMPAAYDTALTEQEFFDVIEYLRSTRN